jgi:hypothetical protein
MTWLQPPGYVHQMFKESWQNNVPSLTLDPPQVSEFSAGWIQMRCAWFESAGGVSRVPPACLHACLPACLPAFFAMPAFCPCLPAPFRSTW